MQQTEKYKLNLIERGDVFSPDALNENTQKVEDVLAEEMEGPVADLLQRVTELEKLKLAYGELDNTYRVMLPFKPVLVVLQQKDGPGVHVAIVGYDHICITITDDGFTVLPGYGNFFFAIGR